MRLHEAVIEKRMRPQISSSSGIAVIIASITISVNLMTMYCY